MSQHSKTNSAALARKRATSIHESDKHADQHETHHVDYERYANAVPPDNNPYWEPYHNSLSSKGN